MFLVRSYKTVTAWEVTSLQENCNLGKIYRKTVQDLRIAWFEARDKAQTMLVQCDANIVRLKQERQQQQRTVGGNKAFRKKHWHALPKGRGNTLKMTTKFWFWLKTRKKSFEILGKNGFRGLQRWRDFYRFERQKLICHQHKVLEACGAPFDLAMGWGRQFWEEKEWERKRKSLLHFSYFPNKNLCPKSCGGRKREWSGDMF